MSDEEQYQQELENYLRKLSADGWCAGWIANLEYTAWEDMLGLSDAEPVFEDYQTNHLCELSRYAGGWFYFQEGVGATFVSMLDWIGMYREWKGAKSGY
jgi:hypothetical protein